MSTYPAAKLLQLWKQNQLTAEQAIGYLLQNLVNLAQRLERLERQSRHQQSSLSETQPPGA